MKKIIQLLAVIIIMSSCEPDNPYEEGSHWDYTIHCENGFVYKHTKGMTIQVLNSDGKPLRCGKKIY